MLGLVATLCFTPAVLAALSREKPNLAGTWTLAFADVVHPDGTRGHDYGDAPKGLLQIDAQGRYSLLIFDSARPRFASNDKKTGTPAEFETTVLGSSAHFGTLEVDAAAAAITFRIEGSSFPNWEHTQQVRKYELRGDVLSYRVPARANGDVPVSEWKRVANQP
jgi:hypothetical protein